MPDDNKEELTGPSPLNADNQHSNHALAQLNTTHYIQQATTDNTRRAYRAAIRQFEAHGGKLPATQKSVADYISAKATQLNPRTLSLHVTALSHWHCYQDLSDPTQSPYIRKLLKGVYRTHGVPKRKAKAFQTEHIGTMVRRLQSKKNLKALRDSALIQVAYFGAFRRSELLAIQVEQVCFESQGVLIMMPRSKTDQSGKGKVKALPYGTQIICPVKALKQWLEQSQITEGFIFRGVNRWGVLQDQPLHVDSFNRLIKKLAVECEFDCIEELSSHSLRRGFATSAARAGVDFDNIKHQGGWQSDHTVREYIEEGQLFDNNAAEQLIQSTFANDDDL